MTDYRVKREGGEDPRYPVTVFLIRDKRPKYWEFLCMFCGAKVCELDGTVVHVRDVSNSSEDANNAAVRVACRGTVKKWCRMWYEFQLGK